MTRLNTGQDLGQKVLQQLVGEWELSREMPGESKAFGTASFTPNVDSLLYHEDVVFCDADLQLVAYQKYEYRLGKSGIDIYFVLGENAGKRFMSLHIENGTSGMRARDLHVCKDDEYTGIFEFRNPDCFVTRYDVKGPRKDYTIRTEYRRKLEA